MITNIIASIVFSFTTNWTTISVVVDEPDKYYQIIKAEDGTHYASDGLSFTRKSLVSIQRGDVYSNTVATIQFGGTSHDVSFGSVKIMELRRSVSKGVIVEGPSVYMQTNTISKVSGKK